MTIDRDRLVRVVTLLALIAATAGYLAWRSHPAKELPPSGAVQVVAKSGLPQAKDTAVIVNLRLSRDQTQSRSIADLEQIASSAQSEQARQTAGDEASQLTQTMREEQESDAVLGAHGWFTATLIDSGDVQVLVAAKKLTLRQVEGIASYVEAVTGLPPQSIRIVPQD
ncbi:MAG: SpoIIIAH-like family protein [Thermaerobacter sp.]|nr:SpoIIIAH-like family protein [Thermaerobacter sp.]